LTETSGHAPQKSWWGAPQDQILNLLAGEDVHIVKRFIPDVEMCFLAEAPGNQNLFLLPFAEVEISFSNCALEKSSFRRIALNRDSSIPRDEANSSDSLQERGILRKVGKL
jgi:hypothetical protein